jgi:hypothetical protein
MVHTRHKLAMLAPFKLNKRSFLLTLKKSTQCFS